MALSDLVPHALRAPKPVAVAGPSSPRVSGVADDAVTPVPEHVEGDLIPYRGLEQHGITPGAQYVDPRGELRKSVGVDHVEHPHDPSPVLVRVVKEDGTERRSWRNFAAVADNVPRMIVGRMPSRTSVTIANRDGNIVWLGNDATVSPQNGYPLIHVSSANDGLKIDTEDEIWALSDNGSPIELRILIEYRRG